MLFVVCDGLSAIAVQRHAVALLRHVLPRLQGTVAPIVVAEQGRVALGDDIGEAMEAEAVAVLIGERPGLSAADSLGVYLTWQPRRGRTDAERNCISNIRPDGPAPGGRRRQTALADRRDAAAAPHRRCTEGRAAGYACPPWIDGVHAGTQMVGDKITVRGRTNMPSAFDAGLSRLHRRSHRGADIPSGNGGGLARGRLGPFAPYRTRTGAAFRRAAHRRSLLLGRALRGAVRSRHAALHLAGLADMA